MRCVCVLLSSLTMITCGWPAYGDPLLQTKSAIAKLNANPTAVPAPETIQSASQPLVIKLKLEKTTFVDGEDVKLAVSSAKGGHVRLYYEDAGGHVVCLFPSDEITAEAAKQHAPISDVILGGDDVVVSGPGSVTGVSLQIGPPQFGTEHISVVVTDVPVKEDGRILEAIRKAKSADAAARLLAGEAIRQDVVTKNAHGRVNNDGVPFSLAGVGLQTVSITTRPK